MLRALVVDDNVKTLKVLSERLLASGEFHVVGWAGSGAEALVHADVFDPDMVLLDLSLGDMSGLDVATQLKRSPRPPYIAIVSTNDVAAYASAAAQAGADAFVSKWEFAERLPGLIADALEYIAAAPSRLSPPEGFHKVE